MKSYNTFLSEQKEFLTEQGKGKDEYSTMSANMANLRGDGAGDILVKDGTGLQRNYNTAYDMKNIMKGLPNILGDEYSAEEVRKLIDGMNEQERIKLEQQINTVKNFHDPKAIKSIQTSFKSREDIDRNNNTMFKPGGYAN